MGAPSSGGEFGHISITQSQGRGHDQFCAAGDTMVACTAEHADQAMGEQEPQQLREASGLVSGFFPIRGVQAPLSVRAVTGW